MSIRYIEISKSFLPTFNVHTTPQQISRTWWVGCRKSCDHSNIRRLVGNLNKAFLLITVNCKNGIWNIHALFWGFGSCVTKCIKALDHFSAGDWRYCGYSLNKFGTARGVYSPCVIRNQALFRIIWRRSSSSNAINLTFETNYYWKSIICTIIVLCTECVWSEWYFLQLFRK